MDKSTGPNRTEPRKGSLPHRDRLRKGAVLQPSGPGWAFKGLGVAPRRILLFHSEDSLGLRSSHQNSCLPATNELTRAKPPGSS